MSLKIQNLFLYNDLYFVHMNVLSLLRILSMPYLTWYQRKVAFDKFTAARRDTVVVGTQC